MAKTATEMPPQKRVGTNAFIDADLEPGHSGDSKGNLKYHFFNLRQLFPGMKIPPYILGIPAGQTPEPFALHHRDDFLFSAFTPLTAPVLKCWNPVIHCPEF